jgi:DNA-binding NtrC family response regulator
MRETAKGLNCRDGEADTPAAPPLPSPQDAEGHAELISLLRDNRPARIVWLDDELTLREAGGMILRLYFKDYALVECSTGDEAWGELSREDPDVFITDNHHTGLSVPEMLERLAENKAKYPVIIASAYQGLEERLLKCAGPNLKVFFLTKPWTAEQLRQVLLIHLGPGDSPQQQSRQGESAANRKDKI